MQSDRTSSVGKALRSAIGGYGMVSVGEDVGCNAAKCPNGWLYFVLYEKETRRGDSVREFQEPDCDFVKL